MANNAESGRITGKCIKCVLQSTPHVLAPKGRKDGNIDGVSGMLGDMMSNLLGIHRDDRGGVERGRIVGIGGHSRVGHETGL